MQDSNNGIEGLYRLIHVNPQYPHSPYSCRRNQFSVINELNEFKGLKFDDSGPSLFLNVFRSQFKDTAGLCKGSSRDDDINNYVEITFKI
jgi:hypothetical protein